MTTFQDLDNKYDYTIEHIDHCRNLALSNEFPAHATWICKPTLTRWFIGAILEFHSNYIRTFSNLREISSVQSRQAIAMHQEIYEKSRGAEAEIVDKYPELRRLVST